MLAILFTFLFRQRLRIFILLSYSSILTFCSVKLVLKTSTQNGLEKLGQEIGSRYAPPFRSTTSGPANNLVNCKCETFCLLISNNHLSLLLDRFRIAATIKRPLINQMRLIYPLTNQMLTYYSHAVRGSGIEVVEVKSEPRVCYSFEWVLDFLIYNMLYVKKSWKFPP